MSSKANLKILAVLLFTIKGTSAADKDNIKDQHSIPSNRKILHHENHQFMMEIAKSSEDKATELRKQADESTANAKRLREKYDNHPLMAQTVNSLEGRAKELRTDADDYDSKAKDLREKYDAQLKKQLAVSSPQQ